MLNVAFSASYAPPIPVRPPSASDRAVLEAVVPAYEAMGIGVVEVPPLPPPLVLRRRRVVVLEAEAGGDRGVTMWIACAWVHLEVGMRVNGV